MKGGGGEGRREGGRGTYLAGDLACGVVVSAQGPLQVLKPLQAVLTTDESLDQTVCVLYFVLDRGGVWAWVSYRNSLVFVLPPASSPFYLPAIFCVRLGAAQSRAHEQELVDQRLFHSFLLSLVLAQTARAGRRDRKARPVGAAGKGGRECEEEGYRVEKGSCCAPRRRDGSPPRAGGLAPFYACCVDLCVDLISVCLDEYQRKRRRRGNGKPQALLLLVLLACPQLSMCRIRFSI